MDPATRFPGEKPPKRKALIDLTKRQLSNDFCPVCHNLSLWDHGPQIEEAGGSDYFRAQSSDGLHEGFEITLVARSESEPIAAAENLPSSPSCQYCALVIECVTRFLPDDVFHTFITTSKLPECVALLAKGTNAQIWFNNEQGTWTLLDLFAFGGKEYPLENQGEPTVELPLYCGPATFDYIENQLNECIRDHERCRLTGPHFNPSRLIFVGQSDEEMHIVETGRDPERLSYFALSHCWGGLNPPRSTKTELQAFKRNINPQILSPVFKNAVEVCRRYDVKYLWIDSLCIIQDDMDDWATEAAQMSMIFENAELVVLATRSANGMQPFIGPQAVYEGEYLEFILHGHQGQKTSIRAMRASNESDNVWCSSGPLAERAWCFQELRLARRSVQFGSTEARWNCQQTTNRESRPLQRSIPRQTDLPSEHFTLYWCDLVRKYSRRSLTRNTDRLPAISALAENLQRNVPNSSTPREYLAGIWSTNWAVQLCWFRMPYLPHTGAFKSPDYVAPSWSWASFVGACAWMWYDLRHYRVLELATLLRWSCVASTVNPYGQVEEDSHLVIRGKAISAYIQVKKPRGFTKYSIAVIDTKGLPQPIGCDFTPDYTPVLRTDWLDSSYTSRANVGDDTQLAEEDSLLPIKCLMVMHVGNFFMALALGGPSGPLRGMERLGLILWRTEALSDALGERFDSAMEEEWTLI